MRWLLLGVVLLVGCGPSQLEKARARLDLDKAAYEQLDSQIKKHDADIAALPPELRTDLLKGQDELKQLRTEAKQRMEESQAEVAELSK